MVYFALTTNNPLGMKWEAISTATGRRPHQLPLRSRIIPLIFCVFNSVRVFLSKVSVSSPMIEILIYQIREDLDQVSILLVTEGMMSLSLVISFSNRSFLPSLDILSMVSFTKVHFGHLICWTASWTSRFLVDQVLIIRILSSILSHARKAGDHLMTSSTWI